MNAGLAESVRGVCQVGDFDGEPVPSAWCGQRAVGRGLAAAWSAAGGAEQETKVAAGQHGEGWCGMHLFCEAEVLTVEGECGVDVVDDVADAHGGHGKASCSVTLARRVRIAPVCAVAGDTVGLEPGQRL